MSSAIRILRSNTPFATWVSYWNMKVIIWSLIRKCEYVSHMDPIDVLTCEADIPDMKERFTNLRHKLMLREDVYYAVIRNKYVYLASFHWAQTDVEGMDLVVSRSSRVHMIHNDPSGKWHGWTFSFENWEANVMIGKDLSEAALKGVHMIEARNRIIFNE